MPRKKETESLHRLCLCNIADNMDKVWIRKADEEFAEAGRFIHIIGPFSHLTGEQNRELIELLIERKYLKKSHLNTLLNPQLKDLNLEHCPSLMVKDATLRLFPVRCQGLTSLNITYCTAVSAAALTEMVRGLPQLRKLNVCGTKASDQTVAAIGESCPRLQLLNLSSCTVTSTGVQALCGNSSSGSLGCQGLVTLDISSTQVCVDGVMAVLRGLPQLQYLDHDNCVEAIARLYETAVAEGHPMPKEKMLRLRALYGSKFEEETPESLQLAAAYCPAVTEVVLMCATSNEMLEALSGLKHLQKLEITSRLREKAPFEEGLSPLLMQVGQGLVSLGAYEMADLDLAAVGLFCPNLRDMQCGLPDARASDLEVESSPLTASQWNSIFCHLRQLTLTTEGDTTPRFCKAFAHLLRNAAGLEELLLFNVQCLDDDMLSDAISLHGFQSLRKLILQECHTVVGTAVGELVRADNALSELVVDTCEEFSAPEFRSFKNFVIINNLDLSMRLDYH